MEEVLFPLQGTHHSGCLLLPTTGGGAGEEVREGGREGGRKGGREERCCAFTAHTGWVKRRIGVPIEPDK